jgi:hypothetical protein
MGRTNVTKFSPFDKYAEQCKEKYEEQTCARQAAQNANGVVGETSVLEVITMPA